MPSSDQSFTTSLWCASAKEPPRPVRRLEGDRSVDVAVIGGGNAGCSAALHLAEGGATVALLEAREIGFGASGRNGGQVIPGLKLEPDALEATFGPERGSRLADLASGAADRVFDLVERHGIACDPVRAGWIQGAHALPALPAVQARAAQWQRRGVPLRMLDAGEIAGLTGTNQYVGGWIDPRAGTIQPLAYVRGLARAAERAGASVYQETAVRRLARQGAEWRIETERGRLVARSVVLATDAYSDGLWPGLSCTFLTVQSILVATEPLPANVLETILPTRACASETRKLAFYFRISPDNRFVLGGRGAVGPAERDSYRRGLEARMHRFYPQLRDSRVAYSWSGQVGLTLDSMIHLHEPEPGLHIPLGYNGRGVAMSTVMGGLLADKLLGRGDDLFPVSGLSPIPGHALRKPGMTLGIAYYWLKDRLGYAS